MKKIGLLFSIIFIIIAQDSVRVVPGSHYKISGFNEIFMGKHWRDIWTSEVQVEVLDLEIYAGGITPFRRGGGFQTKSLRFLGKDGRYYKFRSLDKDPKKVLPKEFQSTFIAEVVQDQISTAHPMSAIIAAELLDEAGVLNAKPILVYLPDSEKLGEFRDEFANLLGTLEEHPDEYEDTSVNFKNSDKVIKSYSLFDKLQTKQDHKVDQEAYLTARLMDIFMGDWDRHEDQWRWAGFKKGGIWTWKPIPRDRDQAFSLYDGFLPWIGTIAVPQIEGFEEDYPQINQLTWSGRHTDRRFLNEIPWERWKEITVNLQSKMSDDVIERALRKMPTYWYQKSADYIRNALQKRRKNLLKASREFYEIIIKYANVYGTDKREYVEVERVDDDHVDVTIHRLSKKGNIKEKLFYRRFHGDETSEIRILLEDGKDKAVVKGEVDESIDVIIEGGKGRDELIDESKVDGHFLYITPIPDAETKTYLYDKGKKTIFTTNASSQINTHRYSRADSLNEKWEPVYRDFGHDWKYGPKLSFNSDDGLIFGLGPILFSHAYLANPYYYRMSLIPSYATSADAFQVDFTASFLDLIYDAEIRFSARVTEFDINRFYGFGNDTKLEFDDENDYYQVGHKLADIRADILFYDKNWTTTFGFTFLKSDIEDLPGTLLDEIQVAGKGSSELTGFHAGLSYNQVEQDNDFIKRGYSISTDFGIYPKLFNDRFRFEEITADFRTYLPITDGLVQATRIYIDYKTGDIPFFEYAFLGQNQLLRGYTRDRFAGKSLFVGNYELRAYLTKVRLLLPMNFGINGFIDTGRVYHETEDSNKIHYSWGGGVWFSIMKNSALMNLTVAKSVESTEVNATLSFGF